MKTLNKKSTYAFSAAALALASVATGCSAAATEPAPSTQGNNTPAGEEALPVRSSVSADEIRAVVGGNTAFAVDLYKELGRTAEKKENIFYSPYSISSALAMTYAGARNGTAAAIAKALHFDLPAERLHAAFGALNAKVIPGSADKSVTLEIANTLFGDRTLKPRAEYASLLERSYGAGVQPLDFTHAPDPSRLTINSWVSKKTHNRINDLLPKGTISSSTRLVLVNAIYFLGNWVSQFDEKVTEPALFTRADRSEVEVSMMRKRLNTGTYVESDLYQSLRLPYKSDQNGGAGYELVVTLPRAGKLGQFESKLSRELIEQLAAVQNVESTKVDLQLPKFELDGVSASLKPALANLGMGAAFGGGADFSGISESRTDSFAISDVLHKAMVKVDEKGTEAAAATAVIVERTSVEPPQRTASMVVNRPFFIFLREVGTGSVLFMGRISDIKQ